MPLKSFHTLLVPVCILLFADLLAAAPPAPGESVEEVVGENFEPVAQPSPTPSPTPQSKPEKTPTPAGPETIGPLEEWVPLPEDQLKTEAEKQKIVEDVMAEEAAEIAEEKRIFDQLIKRYKKERQASAAAPVVKRITATKFQKRRLDKAEKSRRRYVRAVRRARLVAPADHRGGPELRVCAVNLEANASAKTNPAARDKVVVESIAAAGCRAVGVQGLAGSNYREAEEAITKLARSVEAAAGGAWKGFVGGSNHKNLHDAFLVDSSAAQIEGFTPLGSQELADYTRDEEKVFSRGPVKLVLSVPGQGAARARYLVLIATSIRSDADVRGPANEKHRMQMAEALKKILEQEDELWRRESEPPIIMLLLDRASACCDAASRILEGQVKQKDFQTGACHLQEEIKEVPGKPTKKGRKPLTKKIYSYHPVCAVPPKYPRFLFGLARETVELPRLVREKTEDKVKYYLAGSSAEERRKNRERKSKYTEEIYMLPRDLPAAYAKSGMPGAFAVTAQPLRVFAPESPLVMVELNW